MGGHVEITTLAHKDLYNIGKDVVPRLQDELQCLDFEQIDRPEIVLLATGLALILHDLDEAVSRDFINSVLESKCNPVVRSTFNGVLRYSRSNYHESWLGETVILEDKAIDEKYRATQYVLRWLTAVPSYDLKGMPRIYIIKDKEHFDFVGKFKPVLGTITIVWETKFHPYNPIQWFYLMSTEKTLYHEIGHYSHKHVEYGQVPEQEREANMYAAKMFVQNRAWLKLVIKTLKFLLRLQKKTNDC